ncbi:MAG: Structural maintenance of chromosomes protein 3 [Peltula sp. TS41687]|nr:MAG: Structural maintenance of chromosomes protein 3 [Peltula sp. TS41687]
MYIKRMTIQGFKSYKDQTSIEFTPGHNVIVGRNGSGKSNFFAAIRFVLSDAYTQMGREERQALLHGLRKNHTQEGGSATIMSAYVEIIFDNSDERFPTGGKEVTLRRTIGLKKDEYSLDRKNATKADVMNLLESAGFSRSNPYYIVPQGRVTTLTNMKDQERLTLLKEVAGTQVYEARRVESLKIMTETDNKRAKIDELLEYIKDRLGELEEEKEELRAYQEKDRERRCLEYTIYHREQVEIANALDSIDEQRQTGVDETDDNRERFIEGEKEIDELNSEISEIKRQAELQKVDKRQLEDERRDNTRVRAKIELDVKGLSEGRSQAEQAKVQYETELHQVQETIAQRESELQRLLPEFNAKKEEEVGVKRQLDEADAVRQRLYAKQGRNAHFRSKRERDDWLRKEIEEANVTLATRKAILMQTTEDVAEQEETIERITAEVQELRLRFESRGDNMQSMAEQVEMAKEERDRLMDRRKELWREEAKLITILDSAQQELDRAEQVLSHMMDRNTSRGLSAVRRIKRQQNLDGVYGTLAELLEVNERYRTAVEVTAGNSLFHYVVDNDETATRVLEVLQRERSGRVTFMPLNRLRPRPVNLPRSGDAVPMMDKIQFDADYRRAFEQVFGKTIICPNLQIAAQYARSHGVSAITPEGDRSDKKGALTGGFYDPRRSRLEAVKNVMRWRDECETHKTRKEEIRRDIERLDQEITRAVSEVQKIEHKKQQSDASYGPLRTELRSKESLLEKTKDDLAAKKRSADAVDASLREMAEQINSFEAELASEFKKSLTADEERQLEELNSSVQALRKQYAELSTSRSELEARKSVVEVDLRENLTPRLDQLRNQELDQLEQEGGKSSLHEKERQLRRINKAIQAGEKKLREAETAIEQAMSRLSELERRRGERQHQQEEIARAIERHQKRMEKNMAKKSLLTEKAGECSRNIRDLGVLPEEAFERFENTASNTIVKRLHKVNDALKKYGHVNKKAFEQYHNFTKQRDTLIKRRAELDSSQHSIVDLINILDQRKDEAIERTFKQVSREFATTFERLVPAGRGRLVIQRKTDARTAPAEEEESNDDDDDDEEQHGHRKSVENYTGVGISVSFNSKHDDQQRIQQLSGGQKSLCALALVFAIQQCDPAPFYLFDEIDANLDAQYRTAVANMLKEISSGGGGGDAAAATTGDQEDGQEGEAQRDGHAGGGQFICTTFRPEMILVADRCYGVTHINRTSSIDVVEKKQALGFVEGQRQ